MAKNSIQNTTIGFFAIYLFFQYIFFYVTESTQTITEMFSKTSLIRDKKRKFKINKSRLLYVLLGSLIFTLLTFKLKSVATRKLNNLTKGIFSKQEGLKKGKINYPYIKNKSIPVKRK